jgi:hypothetical protein
MLSICSLSLALRDLLQKRLLVRCERLLLLLLLRCALVAHYGTGASPSAARLATRSGVHLPEGTGDGWPEDVSTDECERFDLDHENFEGIAGKVAKSFVGKLARGGGAEGWTVGRATFS